MSGIGRYWHTLRHLQPVQLYARLWFRLARPKVDHGPAPQRRDPSSRGWTTPAPHHVSLIGPDRFRFLNCEHALSDRGWDDTAIEKLWRYNLHYFDDLTAPGLLRTEWQLALMSRWVRENAPARGTGWEPYPTSLRIVNWIKWAAGGGILPEECLQSLAVQARWLSRRLEYHLLANHLFANAKALVFAGLFFDGPEPDAWLATGLGIFEREIGEQILADGGQFERSPMYHALALEDMLDLCNVVAAYAGADMGRRQPPVAKWRAVIDAMRDWLAAMCHPDGQFGFFNDTATGITPSPQELEAYAARLGFSPRPRAAPGLTELRPSGYIRVDRDDAVAILDVAAIGPDYMPGHAHADTLSFELSVFGQRVFVNSGTSCYGSSAERLRQRGTAAHNTVVVNGQDSSEVWNGFRVARRARPVGLHVARGVEIVVRCAHDGYRRLRGAPEHTRQWMFGRRSLTIEDEITGRFDHAEARFHLHPSVKLLDGSVLELDGKHRVHLSIEGGILRMEPSTWHPEFGLVQANVCLAVQFSGRKIRTHINWDGV